MYNTKCSYICTFLAQYEGLIGFLCVVAATAGVGTLSGLFA